MINEKIICPYCSYKQNDIPIDKFGPDIFSLKCPNCQMIFEVEMELQQLFYTYKKRDSEKKQRGTYEICKLL